MTEAVRSGNPKPAQQILSTMRVWARFSLNRT